MKIKYFCFEALIFRPDPVTLGGVGGETGIISKRENWGIFILRIGDRILMKFDI